MIKANYTLLSLFIILFSCVSENEDTTLSTSLEVKVAQKYSAALTELTDEEYPDNPDIAIRHVKCSETLMDSIQLSESKGLVDFTILPSSETDDTVYLKGVSISEFIPSIPDYAQEDEYMSLISVVNQEWNRNQVKWTGKELQKITRGEYIVNGEKITRIDIARNCLNSYLWEVFFYTKSDGSHKVFYHGWFDFPRDLYQDLFNERNKDNFNKYSAHLEKWKDPQSKKIDLERIRTVNESNECQFVVKDYEMYPVAGERKKKKIDIVFPTNAKSMADFHTDSAKFATFSPPGFYTKKEPRTTELGRFAVLTSVTRSKTVANGQRMDEFEFVFRRKSGEVTRFLIGGLRIKKLPHLAQADANSGVQLSMGIGNHPFYESASQHESFCSKKSRYFGILLDKDGNWLDSHKVGIDGPLLHLDKQNPKLLHVWLLSFERQALVGHYIITL